MSAESSNRGGWRLLKFRRDIHKGFFETGLREAPIAYAVVHRKITQLLQRQRMHSTRLREGFGKERRVSIIKYPFVQHGRVNIKLHYVSSFFSRRHHGLHFQFSRCSIRKRKIKSEQKLTPFASLGWHRYRDPVNLLLLGCCCCTRFIRSCCCCCSSVFFLLLPLWKECSGL